MPDQLYCILLAPIYVLSQFKRWHNPSDPFNVVPLVPPRAPVGFIQLWSNSILRGITALVLFRFVRASALSLLEPVLERVCVLTCCFVAICFALRSVLRCDLFCVPICCVPICCVPICCVAVYCVAVYCVAICCVSISDVTSASGCGDWMATKVRWRFPGFPF